MSKAGTRQLQEAMDNLAAVIKIYPSRDDTLTLLADPRRGSDYDGNTRAGISDPTPTQAFQLEPWHYLQQDIRNNLVMAVSVTRALYQLMNRIPSDLDTGALALLHRCQPPTGKEALEPWVRPECTNIIGENSTIRLCDACRQRRDYWRSKQIEGAA